MKIVILDEFTINPGDLSWHDLETFGEVTSYSRTSLSEVIPRIINADIILTSKAILSKKVLEKCKSIKMICILATGYNNIDLDYAKSKGIVVSNIPSYSSQIVAQHTIALLLQLAVQQTPTLPLEGKTLGIIGYGNISKCVIRIASAFDMNILVSTGYPDTDTDFVKFTTFEKVIKNSDFISLHCPMNEQNRGFINSETISLMKPGAMLINTSRGALINSEDLAKAIESEKIGGAALDVLPQEPPINGNPLIGLSNVIITPHIAWSGKSTRNSLIEIAVENVKGFLNGKPVNVV